MTLWARTQQLTGNYLRQVQELYSSRFPMEVRHSIANWLEAQNWYVCLVLFCISFTRSVLSTKMVVDLISVCFFTLCFVWFEIMRENYFWYFNCNTFGGVSLTTHWFIVTVILSRPIPVYVAWVLGVELQAPCLSVAYAIMYFCPLISRFFTALKFINFISDSIMRGNETNVSLLISLIKGIRYVVVCTLNPILSRNAPITCHRPNHTMLILHLLAYLLQPCLVSLLYAPNSSEPSLEINWSLGC